MLLFGKGQEPKKHYYVASRTCVATLAVAQKRVDLRFECTVYSETKLVHLPTSGATAAPALVERARTFSCSLTILAQAQAPCQVLSLPRYRAKGKGRHAERYSETKRQDCLRENVASEFVTVFQAHRVTFGSRATRRWQKRAQTIRQAGARDTWLCIQHDSFGVRASFQGCNGEP